MSPILEVEPVKPRAETEVETKKRKRETYVLYVPAGATVVTFVQGVHVFELCDKDLKKYPKSWLTEVYQKTVGNVVEIEDQTPEYFEYMVQMYKQDSVNLEAEVDKDDFLEEFSFWFPGEPTNLVTYSDFVAELKWKSLISLKEMAKKKIECEMEGRWLKRACEGYFWGNYIISFCGEFARLRNHEDIFAKVAETYGIKVKKMLEHEYEISWNEEGRLYDAAIKYCKFYVHLKHFAGLLKVAQNATGKGNFRCAYKIHERPYMFEHEEVLEAFKEHVKSQTKQAFELTFCNRTIYFNWE